MLRYAFVTFGCVNGCGIQLAAHQDNPLQAGPNLPLDQLDRVSTGSPQHSDVGVGEDEPNPYDNVRAENLQQPVVNPAREGVCVWVWVWHRHFRKQFAQRNHKLRLPSGCAKGPCVCVSLSHSISRSLC